MASDRPTCTVPAAAGRWSCESCGAAGDWPLSDGPIRTPCRRPAAPPSPVPAEVVAARLTICKACPHGERIETPAGDVCDAIRRARPHKAGLIEIGAAMPAAKCPRGAW